MIHLRTFGSIDLRASDGRTVGSVLSQPKRLALLAYLAIDGNGRGHRRDHLLGLFWPEHDQEHARAALRKALYFLRRSLGEGVFEGMREEEVRLAPGAISCDVAEFRRAVEEGRREDAIRLYGGEFMEGFFLPDAPEFERWLETMRARLRRRAADAAWALAGDAEGRAEAEEALKWGRRAFELLGDDELALRRFLSLLDRLGDGVTAHHVYEEYRRRLLEEGGLLPSTETASLAAAIRARSEAEPPLVPSGGAVPSAAADSHAAPGAVTETPIPAGSAPVRASARRLALRWAIVMAGVGGIAWAGSFLLSRRAVPGHPSTVTEGPGTAFRAEGGVIPAAGGAPRPAPDARTIAVLPFANVGGDPEEEYFSDGLTEELIAALSRHQGLQVAAQTSAFAFKGEKRDIRDIGRALNVATVLEGGVRLEEDRFRITARLIDVADGFPLWSETYDRRLTDILEVQAELALQIADALEAELTPAQRAGPPREPTGSLEAYTLYLKGRYFWNRRTRAGFEKALEHFQQALELDPDYSLAYAGLADTYILLGYYSILPPHDAYPKAKDAALRALRIDPTLAEAHSSLAGVFMDYEWSWQDVEREYRRALELNSSYAVAHQWYGNYLIAMGRWQEAIRETLRARQLDPLSMIVNTNVGWVYHLARQHDKAIEEGLKALELDPNFYWAHLLLGRAYEQKNLPEEAIAAYETASTLSGGNSMVLAELGHAYAGAGRRTDAERILANLMRPSDREYASSYDIALVHLGLGERDEAIAWLEKSYQERARALGFANVEPRLDPLRPDPRFQELLRRMEFPGQAQPR